MRWKSPLYDLFQGKFIRIHFHMNGKLASADIETCKLVWITSQLIL